MQVSPALLPSAAGGGVPPAAVFVAAGPAHQLAAEELQRYLHLSSASGLAACELWAGAGGGAVDGGAGASAAHDGVALLTAETWRERLPALMRQPDDGLDGEIHPELTNIRKLTQQFD